MKFVISVGAVLVVALAITFLLTPKETEQFDPIWDYEHPERSDYIFRRKGKRSIEDVKKAERKFTKVFQRTVTKDAGISNWTDLGPSNIGGRVRAIQPTRNPNLIFAGSAGGGILRGQINSTNGSISWSIVDDAKASLAISCMAIDSSGTNDVIYAGTGEFFAKCPNSDCGDGRPGVGVLRSLDGGQTFTTLALPTAQGSNNYDNYWIAEITTDPQVPGSLYVLSNQMDQSGGVSTPRGVIHRSTDFGTTWLPSIEVRDNNSLRKFRFLSDIKITKTTSEIYVTTYDPTLGLARILFSNDSGDTFSTLRTLNAGRGEIALDLSNPNRVYISFASISSGIDIWRTDDKGLTWTLPSLNNDFGGQENYNNTIWVDPISPNNLFAGGVNLFKSEDSGVSWDPISDWRDYHNGVDTDGDGNVANSLHADQHYIIEASNYSLGNRKVWFANDGGVASTDNIVSLSTNSGYDLHSFAGFSVTQFYSGAGNNGQYIGGTQDNCFISYTTGTQWYQETTGDGGYAVIDRSSGNQIVSFQRARLSSRASFNSPSTFHSDFDFSCNCCGANNPSSTPNCDCSTSPYWCECPTFTCCSGGNLNAPNGCSDNGRFVVSDNPDFIAPIIKDPNIGNTIYVGASRLWINSNAWGSNPSAPFNVFTPIKNAITGTFPVANPQLSAIAIAESNSQIIWVGYNNGTIERTTVGGGANVNWSGDLAPTPQPSFPFVTDIAICPSDANKVIISYGGYSSDNLYMTTNALANSPHWTNINPGVSVQINAVEWHPTNDQWIYLGTDFGILASDNNGVDWNLNPIFSGHDGPANVEVSDIFWEESNLGVTTRLLAATHGRGMWISNIIRDSLFVDKNHTFSSTGTRNSPYVKFEDALNVAGHGSTIVFLSSGTHDEVLNNSVVVDKRIKIVFENGGSPVLIE